MSLSPVTAPLARLPQSIATDPSRAGGVRPEAARPEGTRPPATGGAAPSAATAAAAAPRALTAQAPAGVDPALWDVLTTEERAQFSRLSALGPLTYGPLSGIRAQASATPPAARGARLDIRA